MKNPTPPRTKLMAMSLGILLLFTGCGSTPEAATKASAAPLPNTVGSRPSTPTLLTVEAPGTEAFEGKASVIDVSNTSDGYIMVKYTGDKQKIKMQLTKAGGTTYTYDLFPDNQYDAFPLSDGDGAYTITINENISGTSYAQVDTAQFNVTITDPLSPYVRPNQYVEYAAGDSAVTKGETLAKAANSDLDVVTYVYDYVTGNIEYDYDFAATVSQFYIPDNTTTMSTGKGICFDYAVLMTSMLRSQGIPTQLVLGYAGEAYHAWISVYTPETGWIHDIIQFDGKNWVRMDPTFASTGGDNPEVSRYVGDGKNYNAMYFY